MNYSKWQKFKKVFGGIEADRFEQLPGTFYVRAFIRQYAAAVGEDGDKLVSVFDGKDTLAEPLPKDLNLRP